MSDLEEKKSAHRQYYRATKTKHTRKRAMNSLDKRA